MDKALVATFEFTQRYVKEKAQPSKHFVQSGFLCNLFFQTHNRVRNRKPNLVPFRDFRFPKPTDRFFG